MEVEAKARLSNSRVDPVVEAKNELALDRQTTNTINAIVNIEVIADFDLKLELDLEIKIVRGQRVWIDLEAKVQIVR